MISFQTEYTGKRNDPISHWIYTGKRNDPISHWIYTGKRNDPISHWIYIYIYIYIGKRRDPISHWIYTGKRSDPISHWIYIWKTNDPISHWIYTGKRNDSISHWTYTWERNNPISHWIWGGGGGGMKETGHHLDNESKCKVKCIHSSSFFKWMFFNRLWQNSLLWTTQRCSFEDRKNALIFLPLKTTRKLTINQSLWVFQTRSCTRSKHKMVQTNAYR